MTAEDRIPILQQTQETKSIKLILCGDYGSGKTSLIERHVNKTFTEGNQSPKEMTKVRMNIKIKNSIETLMIWDTNGEEKYKSLQLNHFRNANCAIIVFDVSNESSFESIEYWYKMIRLYSPNIPILVAGNKIDKRIFIPFEEASKFCLTNDCDLIYCSAKTGVNVNKVFRHVVHSYFNVSDDQKGDNEDKSFVLSQSQCCKCCVLL